MKKLISTLLICALASPGFAQSNSNQNIFEQASLEQQAQYVASAEAELKNLDEQLKVAKRMKRTSLYIGIAGTVVATAGIVFAGWKWMNARKVRSAVNLSSNDSAPNLPEPGQPIPRPGPDPIPNPGNPDPGNPIPIPDPGPFPQPGQPNPGGPVSQNAKWIKRGVIVLVGGGLAAVAYGYLSFDFYQIKANEIEQLQRVVTDSLIAVRAANRTYQNLLK
jgi:hypothetical protein